MASRQKEGRFDTFMPEEAMGTNHPAAWDAVSLEDVDEAARLERGTHMKYGQCSNQPREGN